jgi:hypothetical protein
LGPETARGLGVHLASEFCHLCGRELSGQGKSFQHLCLTCGQPTRGRYFEFNGVGPYCRDCVRDRAACDVCSAPLTDEQWQLSDGRVFCAYCQATIVFGPAEAMSLYEEMKAVVIEEFGLRLNIPTGLALVDRNQLGVVINQQRNQTGGDRDLDPKQTLGIYARRGMRRGIYIQTGLPRTLFLQVAAHEYAHAWQGENCPLLRDTLIHEGFAEWLAYHVIGYYGYTQGQEHMLARQDVYGNGLRLALEVEARDGVAGVLQACRRST